MSLEILFILSALWSVTMVTTTSKTLIPTGRESHVTWDVTKISKTSEASARLGPGENFFSSFQHFLSSDLVFPSKSSFGRNSSADHLSLRLTSSEEEVTGSSGSLSLQRALPENKLMSSNTNVIMRLQKLNYYFATLRIWEEDCRHRLLCEVARDPAKFSPLAVAFLDETRFIGDEKFLASRLLNTQAGTKLLTYIDATLRGRRRNGCEVYSYRCPKSTESMINYETLLVWREISKWLTVKMISRSTDSE